MFMYIEKKTKADESAKKKSVAHAKWRKLQSICKNKRGRIMIKASVSRVESALVDSSCKWEPLRGAITRRSWTRTGVRTNRFSRSERAERSEALRGITTIIRIITRGVSGTGRANKADLPRLSASLTEFVFHSRVRLHQLTLRVQTSRKGFSTCEFWNYISCLIR